MEVNIAWDNKTRDFSQYLHEVGLGLNSFGVNEVTYCI